MGLGGRVTVTGAAVVVVVTTGVAVVVEVVVGLAVVVVVVVGVLVHLYNKANNIKYIIDAHNNSIEYSNHYYIEGYFVLLSTKRETTVVGQLAYQNRLH